MDEVIAVAAGAFLQALEAVLAFALVLVGFAFALGVLLYMAWPTDDDEE